MEKTVKTDAEWRAQLSKLAYKVTQKSATEPAFSNDSYPDAKGIFHCVCCDAVLFDMDAKFDSGTGWPSFYQPVSDDSVKQKTDRKFFITRTEVICAGCDSHLGHVFPDGPQPTGLRFCMNGSALEFKQN